MRLEATALRHDARSHDTRSHDGHGHEATCQDVKSHDSNVFVLDTLPNAIDPVTSQARECLRQQAASIAKLSARLDETFARSVRLLLGIDGHVVITGLGKSGLVGRKIAATLASTGTPSFFVHSGEAFHGDLGMITDDDAVILISYSGETSEVTALLPHLRARGIPTIALVGKLDSTLARGVDVALDVSVDREVCPNNLAPTSSTLATLALGDTLAVALMKLRGFHAGDFAKLHPGGSVGLLLKRVGDCVVREGISILTPESLVRDGLLALASSQYSIALVCDGSTLLGVLTPDDIREGGATALDRPVMDVMSRPPVIEPSVFLTEAGRRMDRDGVQALVVVDANGEVRGVLPRHPR